MLPIHAGDTLEVHVGDDSITTFVAEDNPRPLDELGGFIPIEIFPVPIPPDIDIQLLINQYWQSLMQ